jgi:hypothetical protein
MKMKKVSIIASSLLMVATMFSTSAMAAPDDQVKTKTLINSIEIPIEIPMVNSLKSNENLTKNLILSQYDDNGIKVYTVEGADTPEEKYKAFEILNKFMESGEIQQSNVSVTTTNQDFYGNEYGNSPSNSNVQGYTWARYNAGKGFASNKSVTDKTWGGSSGVWGGTGTAGYIKLNQLIALNVSGASHSLTLSWPPGYSISSTKSTSTASYSTDAETGVNVLGAEHQLLQFNKEDIQGGKVTSAVHTDVADVKVGSTIYKATSSVRFTNDL